MAAPQGGHLPLRLLDHMTFRLITFALLALVLAPCRAEEQSETIEIHAPAVHPGYPDYFNLRYVVDPSSVSPNHQFALIYPTRAASFETAGPRENFLVALNPFRIVGGIETKEPYFDGENHSGFSATWSPDSSVVLVQIDAKWGPRSEHLIELREGRITRQTDLAAEVRKLLQPDFRRAKVERYNEYYDFVFDAGLTGGGFALEKSDRSANPLHSDERPEIHGNCVDDAGGWRVGHRAGQIHDVQGDPNLSLKGKCHEAFALRIRFLPLDGRSPFDFEPCGKSEGIATPYRHGTERRVSIGMRSWGALGGAGHW